MNVAEILDMAKFFYAFNDAQSDNPFTDARWIQLLNWSYKRVWIDVSQNVSKKHLLAYQDITWASGVAERELEPGLQNKSLYTFRDITDTDQGALIVPGWLNRTNLSWYPDGPSSDRTVRVFYIASPETLTDGGPGPELIPADFHEIIAWDCVNQLSLVSDGSTNFQAQLYEWQQRLMKALATRPLGEVARIVINEDGWYEPALPTAAVSGGGYSDTSAPLTSP